MVTKLRSRIIAQGMLRENTPIEDYTKEYGLFVKREDLACPNPGPPFSKTRGVYSHILNRPESVIGVLDTYHSQAGHAVARACQILGKKCLNFYPEFKYEPGPRQPQISAQALGAELIGLKAGRSAILFHDAKKQTIAQGGYMMPNALKLQESITETAKEVPHEDYDWVIIPTSSGTIAAGVIHGFLSLGKGKIAQKFIIHLGYSRSHEEVGNYLRGASGVDKIPSLIIDEGYSYKDTAKAGETPTWRCNPYYDLKAFRWWMKNRDSYRGKVLFWNIG